VTARDIRIIGVPMDLGQSRRGVDMGPSAVRYAGLDDRLRDLGHRVADWGNVTIPIRDELAPENGLDYLPAFVAGCRAVCDEGKRALAEGTMPIFLGGDHSIALGTVSAATSLGGRTGVLWIDAHGDFNTPQTSPSGNIHGMPLAALVGLGAPSMVDFDRPGPKLASRDIALIGTRSLDPAEGVALRASDAAVFSMHEVDLLGIAAVAELALGHLAHCDRVHVSLDLDSIDPRLVPGVGTPVPGGLTVREAHLLMEHIRDRIELCSLDVVEVNPILDERNCTAEVAVDLVTALLGRHRTDEGVRRALEHR
jgi:arginase